MLRRIARELVVFLFYLSLAVAMTWPLARHLPTALSDLGDPLLILWIIDWVNYALLHSPFHLYDSPMYYPGRLGLAYSENLIGVALMMLPFHLAGLTPITIYNIALLLGFALSGYGSFVLARMITRSVPASLIAGIIFAFVPFKFDHLSHLQIIWSGWIALLLAAVIAYFREPRPRQAVLLAAAFVMNGLTNVHYLLFGSLTALITIAALAVLDPRRGRRFWMQLAGALVAGGLVLLPFLLPYRIVAKKYGMRRSAEEALSGSAPPSAWLAATPRNVLYGDLGPDDLHRHEMQLFPGLVAIALAIAGVLVTARGPSPSAHAAPSPASARGRSDADQWGSEAPGEGTLRVPRALDLSILAMLIMTYLGAVTERTEWTMFGRRILSFDSADVPATVALLLIIVRLTIRYPLSLGGDRNLSLRGAASRSRFPAEAWAAAIWIAIGTLGSFGMNTFFHAFLYRRIGPFQAVRAPVRWAIIAYVGLAVWAAIGATAILQRRKGRARQIVAAILIAAATVDLWPSIRWEHAVPTIAPVYRWLASARPGPILELPISGGTEFRYMLSSTVHRLPQFNGISHFGPPVYRQLREKDDARQFDDEFLDILEKNGARIVVVHVHALGDASTDTRRWLRAAVQSGRLIPLRSFDHDVGGDFVFGVARNLTAWRDFAEPDVPDGAGDLPRQKLAKMLDGRPTHSNLTMAVIESPRQGETVEGPLRIRGWTLSPVGIQRVTALIDNGEKRYNIPLAERADITRQYSWYYFTPQPGFDLTLARPKGVPKKTDVQIEIVDRANRVTHTEDVLIEWK